ncbi:MAG: ATP-binding protein [Spirochaetales bacterium]|nr:ATP-binding protein [Spirochaetales bacterium]MCF7939277.1 ATP-binding protein [Spirochaetales bacterium]
MHRTVSDIITDLVQNSVEAKAGSILIEYREDERLLTILLGDNGSGMEPDVLERAKDPFANDGKKHPGRRVGLGIPFAVQTAEMTEGSFDIDSDPEQGTSVKLQLIKDHPDIPPIGDLVSCFAGLMSLSGDFEMIITRVLETSGRKDSYRLQRSELIDALGDLESSTSLGLLDTYIRSQEEALLDPANKGG